MVAKPDLKGGKVFLMFFTVIALLALSFSANAAAPAKQWDKSFGGAVDDIGNSAIQTSDGGYAIIGYTRSFSIGSSNFWLIKTDSSGNMQWNKTYYGGITGQDYGQSVVQTPDGGYALSGSVNCISDTTCDFWLIKTDENGTAQWNKTFGGSGYNHAQSLIMTSDGGYAITGFTNALGAGNYDFWLVKTDENGTEQWNKTFGGAKFDAAYSVIQAPDGGYVLAGINFTYKIMDTDHRSDIFLVKTDSSGNQEWNKRWGVSGWNWASSVINTSDGGYAIGGWTDSFGAGNRDYWLIKTNSSGDVQWNKTYGGVYFENANSVIQTSDGGYALFGSKSFSNGGPDDFWLVKTNSSGNQQWNKTFDGGHYDEGYSAIQTSDGGYALGGSKSLTDDDHYDIWLIKIGPEAPAHFPNYDVFSGGETTDFYSVSNLSSVPNLTLSISGSGKIVWNDSQDANDMDFDSNVKIESKFISVNTAALGSGYNSSATITFEGVGCPFNPNNLVYANGYYTTISALQADGATCPSEICSNLQCVGSDLTFDASHFTGFAALGNTSLTINDSAEGSSAFVNNSVDFYAYYVNASGNQVPGATCTVYFDDATSGGMSGNPYTYTKSSGFASAGTHNWNVTCSAAGYNTLTALDDVSITSSSSSNLTINDSAEGSYALIGSTAYFYAYYVNASGSQIPGATCTVYFDDVISGGMSGNPYSYTKIGGFGSAGLHNWNVTCSKIGYDTLTALDNINILSSPPTAPAPEFSDYALMLMAVGVVGVILFRRRQEL